MTNDDYQKIAQYYDLEFDEFNSDLDLYLGYASVVGSPILELGCGTGRLIRPLAAEGHTVIGLDSSPAMLERARARVEDARAESQPTLVQGDMRSFHVDVEEPFRLVICAINSFLHLPSRDDQLASLRAVNEILDRDGLLVIDIFHPSPSFLHDIDDRVRHDHAWTTSDGTRIDRFSHRRLHATDQRISTTLYFDSRTPSGQLQREITSYEMRYIHRFEMEGLLDQAGYNIEGIYGSYHLDPLTDDSSQMIFVAHRRPRADEDPLL